MGYVGFGVDGGDLDGEDDAHGGCDTCTTWNVSIWFVGGARKNNLQQPGREQDGDGDLAAERHVELPQSGRW